MKNKKRMRILLAGCLLAGLLAACGAPKEEAAGSRETAEAAEEEAAADAKSTGAEAQDAGEASSDYEPVTITLNLERSGLGENVEYTFTEMPSKVVASGDQMADFFFDLGLQGLAGSIRRLFVGHLDHIQLTVTAQALGVFAYGVLVKFFFDFPYGDQRDPHDFWSPNSKSISYHTAPPWTEADTPMFL